MKLEELLEAPKRKWDEEIHDVAWVYIMPTEYKHDSGWACMEFAAMTGDGYVRFGGGCDDVSFEGEHFRMDCDYESKLLRIWNHNKFAVSVGLSSISFEER